MIPLEFEKFRTNLNLSEIDIDTKEEILKGKHETFYKVTISDLYDSTITEHEPKKKIIDKFLSNKIQDSILNATH